MHQRHDSRRRRCVATSKSRLNQQIKVQDMTNTQNNRAESVLAKFCEPLQIVAQRAEAQMRSVDSYINQLNRSGLLHRTIVLGPIIISRSYGIDSPSDSGELILAAVTTDHGTTAVFWDSEDYASYRHDPEFEAESLARARPLRDCPPAIQSLIWPQIKPLLMRLISTCKLN